MQSEVKSAVANVARLNVVNNTLICIMGGFGTVNDVKIFSV